MPPPLLLDKLCGFVGVYTPAVTTAAAVASAATIVINFHGLSRFTMHLYVFFESS